MVLMRIELLSEQIAAMDQYLKAVTIEDPGEVTEALWEEYEAFQQRDLRDIPALYVFVDGLYEPLRMHGIQREAVLCAWAITTKGDKVLLSLALGNQESYDAWLSFLRDQVSRCRTITSDGAPGAGARH